jgi:hypothetical protein
VLKENWGAAVVVYTLVSKLPNDKLMGAERLDGPDDPVSGTAVALNVETAAAAAAAAAAAGLKTKVAAAGAGGAGAKTEVAAAGTAAATAGSKTEVAVAGVASVNENAGAGILFNVAFPAPYVVPNATSGLMGDAGSATPNPNPIDTAGGVERTEGAAEGAATRVAVFGVLKLNPLTTGADTTTFFPPVAAAAAVVAAGTDAATEGVAILGALKLNLMSTGDGEV